MFDQSPEDLMNRNFPVAASVRDHDIYYIEWRFDGESGGRE